MAWTDDDKEIADTAAATLTRLQGRTDAASLEEVKRVADRVANKRTDEHERAAAWLEVKALVMGIEKHSRDTIPALYSNAIKALNGWRGSMKQ
jgi:hypothetical protein